MQSSNNSLFHGNKVESEIEAYLLGLFYADGCVAKFENNAYRIFRIAFSEKDKDFLQKIIDIVNEKLCTQYSIKRIDKLNAYYFGIYKKEFIKNIIRLGISPNKTYENDDFVFQNVPSNFKRHFIRGYFDGDGCISFYKQKNRCTVSIVSLNHMLLKAIQEYVQSIFGFGTIRTTKNRYSEYQICGNISAKTFMDWLYQKSVYYLQRKYERYLQIPLKHHTNIYKGITKEKRSPNALYKVTIYADGKRHWVGEFHTVKEAVNAYNIFAERFGVSKQKYQGNNLQLGDRNHPL